MQISPVSLDYRQPLPQVITIPFLTGEKCGEIIANSGSWCEGTVFKFGQFIKSKEHRSVQISRLGIGQELEDQIFKTIFLANTTSFRYHLEGFNKKDPALVFKYSSDRDDHYTWHTDMLRDSFVRKLSFTIQLSDSSDYTGGDLEFMPGVKDSKIRQQGVMTIFPSFLTHRVTAVSSGTRYAIIGWIYGPEFK
jgi:PKHD-type hydroxylase